MMARPLPNPQHIHIVLNPKDGGDVYIDIPYAEIQRLSPSPSRLLHYFCFIILGLQGTLHVDAGRRVALEREKGDDMGTNIEAGGTYLYHVEGNNVPFTSSLVDPEAVPEAGSKASTSSQSCLQTFQSRLDVRDDCGIFTGVNNLYSEGQHIIAHSKGDEWVKLILENRPRYDLEDISGFEGIDDPRNVFLESRTVHTVISKQHVFIFKTPNRYLHHNDIPQAVARDIPSRSAAPSNCRFTMMWAFDNPRSANIGFTLPSDATFAEPNATDLPSGVLLDYFNAGVIYKNYLKGIKIIDSHTFPRPQSPPVPYQRGHKERLANRKSHRQPPPPDADYRPERDKDADDDEQYWDSDEYIDAMVLRNWMMSGNAQRRREKNQQERTEWINSWISKSAMII